jgi:cardiolipin synthase
MLKLNLQICNAISIISSSKKHPIKLCCLCSKRFKQTAYKPMTNQRLIEAKVVKTEYRQIVAQRNYVTNLNNHGEHQTQSKEDLIITIPNALTSLRIMCTPFINYFLLINKHEYAFGLFIFAGITDFLDGYIARNWPNQKSILGSILDPLADKLLIGSLTVTLTLEDMLPLELAVLILLRDVSLIVFSLYVRYSILEKPVTLNKFLNVKKYSTVQVKPDQISKMNTLFQIALIAFTVPSVMLDYNSSLFLVYLQYLTGFTTILSSLSYLYKRGSYKVINK